jgi:hypothetical protein
MGLAIASAWSSKATAHQVGSRLTLTDLLIERAKVCASVFIEAFPP